MDLKVQKRDKFGGQLATLRKEGLIPAELYGHGIENIHLAVPFKDFRTAYRAVGENRVLKNETFLYPEFVPERLPHRDKEIDELVFAFNLRFTVKTA